MKLLTGTILALALATGPVFAQTTPPKATAPTAAPTATAPDAAVQAKFKAADKNNSGALEGAEVDAYKADLTKIDADKDGKISMAEFAAATKAGVIK